MGLLIICKNKLNFYQREMSEFDDTYFPGWNGFVFPTSTTDIVLVVVSGFGAAIVSIVANLTVFASEGLELEDAYNPQLLCIDSLGDIGYAVLTIVQMAIIYSRNVNYFFWFILMPPYVW